MIANKFSILWPKILTILILLVAFPLLTGFFVAIVQAIYTFNIKMEDLYTFGYLSWGYTLFYFNWTFLLVVLLPYYYLYKYTLLKEKNIFTKFITFYGLLTIMGVIFPYASIVNLIIDKPYPRILFLYIFLTLTICPLYNLVLDKILQKEETFSSNAES